ncbi:hypothetical protein BGZ65_012887, partial [Modicella reniformis]
LDAAKPYQDGQAEGEVQEQVQQMREKQDYDGEQEEQEERQQEEPQYDEEQEDEEKDHDDDWEPENNDSDHGKALLARLEAHLNHKKILQSISEEEREKLNAVLHGKSHRFADKLETWAVEFKRNGAITRSQRGRHAKQHKLLLNEDIKMEIREWLYSE